MWGSVFPILFASSSYLYIGLNGKEEEEEDKFCYFLRKEGSILFQSYPSHQDLTRGIG